MMMANATAGLIGIEWGLTGPNFCVATACAAGANSIGEAARLVREGACDVVVAGGTECALTPVSLAAFWRMGALSSNPDPAAASRPFDADRDGFVMGEGAAFLVLEEAEAAAARGATIWASSSATAAPATPTTSRRPPRAAPARWRAWRRRSPTPGSPPARSAT